MFPFDPPENIRKTKGFLMFQGDQKEKLGRIGLKSRQFHSNFDSILLRWWPLEFFNAIFFLNEFDMF